MTVGQIRHLSTDRAGRTDDRAPVQASANIPRAPEDSRRTIYGRGSWGARLVERTGERDRGDRFEAMRRGTRGLSQLYRSICELENHFTYCSIIAAQAVLSHGRGRGVEGPPERTGQP